ncbi:formyltransferase family protein [Niveispirillum sp. KHB5.9]|uniref:formyltransferase family protein n=1 Tax=Niveispirillum sp. KHB5.9 TaxID=3400269 RepID=UPI003A84EE93
MPEAIPASLTVPFDRLLLATVPDLLPALLPLLPGVQPVDSLDRLRAALDHDPGSSVRLVCIGFGRVVPPDLLARCRAGAINIHPGPHLYPGSAAAHLALYEGAEWFGVTAHLMSAAVDAGPILAEAIFPIPPDTGHRGLDELTWSALLSLLHQLAPAIRGDTPWPRPPGLSWWGHANRRADIIALARITDNMVESEVLRRWRAFHDGPDSALTIQEHGQVRPYQAQGRIIGWVDGIVGDAIQGWAHDPASTDMPVHIRVEVDGHPFRDLAAYAPRGDVAAAGHGDGHCGFSLALSDLPQGAVRVDFLLPADEWRRLPGGPVMLHQTCG